jgi:hypothetical protein
LCFQKSISDENSRYASSQGIFERSELVMKLKGDLDQLKVRVYLPKNIRKHFLITLIELIYAASRQ